MFKKIFFASMLVISIVGLTACSKKEGSHTVTVGTISGPETQLMQVAKQVALKQYGLHVKIIAFSDYITPNTALSDGDIDANAFQHLPYLTAQVKEHGYNLVPVGKTLLYPVGGYSQKIKSINALKNGAKVAIPNDPSNEARALLLLQKYHLVRLQKGTQFNATPINIVSNPKHLKFIELDAAQLPRSLQDVDMAIVNTNYAIAAGLSPSKDAIIKESRDSPYTNIIAARASDKHLPKITELVKAYQSPAVAQKAHQLFGAAAIIGWHQLRVH